MQKRVVIVASVVIIIVVVAIIAVLFLQGSNLLPGPKAHFTIISKDLDTTTEGILPPDYVAYVYVTVKNDGDAAGSPTIYVKVMQGGDSWQKSQSCHLNAGESDTLTFKFSEIEFWTTNPVTYTVWLA